MSDDDFRKQFEGDPTKRRLWDPEEIAKMPDSNASNVITTKLSKTERAVFGDQRALTCGSCKFFRHSLAQKRMRDEQFLPYLVHEANWRVEHLAQDHKNMAICDQHGDMLVGPISKACEFYRPASNRR